MVNEQTLLAGFATEDKEKIRTHLHRLLPYLDTERIVIVGGLAIRYYVIQAGIAYPQRPINDLDILAQTVDVLSKAVKNEFLIYHFHPRSEEGKFFIALVDPISKTKIDIFDYTFQTEELQKVVFEDYTLSITSPEDQLVKTVFDIQRISPEAKVDPKQFCDARLLLQIVDRKKAELFWKRKNFSGFPDSLMSAFEKAEIIAKRHPEWLKEKPFQKRKPYICPDCVHRAEFPITPMTEIYKTLGYVE